MRSAAEASRRLWSLLLRTLLLYFLLIQAWLYFRRELDLVFLSAGFLLAVLLGAGTARVGLRFLPALAAFALLLAGLRALSFLGFRLLARADPGPRADFLFFTFDKDFLPALLPWSLAWILSFLPLRLARFGRFEPAVHAALLLAVFWPQGGYRLTLYPHPSLAAAAVFVFLAGELALLLLEAGEHEVKKRADARSLASYLALILSLLAALAFLLLGRYNQGAVRQGGGLMKPTLFRFDFSPYVRLESSIRMSDDLVLLFRKEGPAERLLLRRYILSGYERRRGFYHLAQKGVQELPTTVSDAPEQFPDPGYRARTEVSQEYFFVNFDPTSLLALNYPVRVTPLEGWEGSSFLRIYRVMSRASSAGAEELAVAGHGGLSPAELKLYTEYGADERIRELALSIAPAGAGGEAGTYERVLGIQEHLKNNYLYSLRPGLAEDGDQLAHFLFSSRKGYCSYFAFAMALLARSLGIPARVAVGFLVDPEAEVLNFYEVRAYQAHAWVEVYFRDYGWIEFDPSSERIAPGEEYLLQFGLDFQRLARLIEEILRNQDRLRERVPPAEETAGGLRRWGGQAVRGLELAARMGYLTLPALYLLALAFMKGAPHAGLLFIWERRRRVKRLFLISLVPLYSLGLVRRAQESLLEYASRAESASPGLRLRSWVEAYLEAVFAQEFGLSEYRQALERRQAFRRSSRDVFPLLRRLASFLNPRHALRGWSRSA